MYFIGHFGLSVGVAHAANQKVKSKIDLRWAGLLGLAPDLIDKPITLSNPAFFHYNTRAVAHNLFVALFLMGVFVACQKRKASAAVLALFYFGHLLLDRMWIKSPQIFFYPFDGAVPSLTHDILGRWWTTYFEPYSFSGEVAGFAILLYLFFRYALYRAPNRRALWEKGYLS